VKNVPAREREGRKPEPLTNGRASAKNGERKRWRSFEKAKKRNAHDLERSVTKSQERPGEKTSKNKPSYNKKNLNTEHR